MSRVPCFTVSLIVFNTRGRYATIPAPVHSTRGLRCALASQLGCVSDIDVCIVCIRVSASLSLSFFSEDKSLSMIVSTWILITMMMKSMICIPVLAPASSREDSKRGTTDPNTMEEQPGYSPDGGNANDPSLCGTDVVLIMADQRLYQVICLMPRVNHM
jgi:hypothetical protein